MQPTTQQWRRKDFSPLPFFFDKLVHQTHMSEKHIIFDISCASLQRQHHLARSPYAGKVQEVPFVLVAFVCL